MKKILVVIITITIFILIDGFFINSKGFIIHEENITIDNLPDSFNNFKILQISDTLIKDSNDLKRIKKIVTEANTYKPDIIFFTGDLLSKDNTLSNDDITTLSNYLKELDCTLYKYATIGDNDKAFTNYKDILSNADFQVLDNTSIPLFYKEKTPIKIIGITDTNYEDTLDYDTYLNIAITHYSDNFDTLKNQDIDLVFAGNSLHGQINIPFYGGLFKFNGSKKYINDYYEENDTRLYISNGIGNNKINFRLFNKPSITIYRLKAK